jgi:hypothetical protein
VREALHVRRAPPCQENATKALEFARLAELAECQLLSMLICPGQRVVRSEIYVPLWPPRDAACHGARSCARPCVREGLVIGFLLRRGAAAADSSQRHSACQYSNRSRLTLSSATRKEGHTRDRLDPVAAAAFVHGANLRSRPPAPRPTPSRSCPDHARRVPSTGKAGLARRLSFLIARIAKLRSGSRIAC